MSKNSGFARIFSPPPLLHGTFECTDHWQSGGTEETSKSRDGMERTKTPGGESPARSPDHGSKDGCRPRPPAPHRQDGPESPRKRGFFVALARSGAAVDSCQHPSIGRGICTLTLLGGRLSAPALLLGPLIVPLSRGVRKSSRNLHKRSGYAGGNGRAEPCLADTTLPPRVVLVLGVVRAMRARPGRIATSGRG